MWFWAGGVNVIRTCLMGWFDDSVFTCKNKFFSIKTEDHLILKSINIKGEEYVKYEIHVRGWKTYMQTSREGEKWLYG